MSPFNAAPPAALLRWSAPRLRRGWPALLLAAFLGAGLLALPVRAPAQNMEEWYREGMAHLHAGRKAAAQVSFLRVLGEVPDHFRSMTGLAELYLESAPQKSLEYADRAIRMAPSYETAHYVRGQTLERLERDEAAAEAYRQVIRINPRHSDANTRLRAVLRRMQERRSQVQQASERFWAEPSLRTLTLFGQMLLQHAKPEEALAELEPIRVKLPRLPEANLWIARAQRAAGNVDGEQEAYQRYLAVRDALGVRLLMAERLEAIGRYRSAMDVLAPIEADPRGLGGLDRLDRGRLAYLRSRSLLTRRQFAGVGEQLLEAGRLGYDPERVTAAFQEDLSLYDGQAVLWNRSADWRLLRGDPDGAAAARAQACRAERSQCPEGRKALEAMRGAGKTPPAVLLALGEVALAEGKPAEALELLQRVQPGHDAFRRAQLLQGLIFRSTGDTTRAVDALMRYVFLFPDRGGMLYARGTLFWEMGERDVAVAVWREHPEVLATHPELLARLALHLQGKNDPAAERVFRAQLAQAQPELAANHLRLGDLYRDAHRPADAVREWHAALERRPRDADLLLHIARAFLAEGKTDDALPLLRQAWQLQNLPPDLAVVLAQQLATLRQPAQALQVYWQIYHEAPGQPAMRQALPELALSTPTPPGQRRAAAEIALQTERPKLAEDLLTAALQERPADPDSRKALADFYRQRGRDDAAERVMSGNFFTSPPKPAAPAPEFVERPPPATAERPLLAPSTDGTAATRAQVATPSAATSPPAQGGTPRPPLP